MKQNLIQMINKLNELSEIELIVLGVALVVVVYGLGSVSGLIHRKLTN
ncbi:MAG: hypothetical protein VW333_12710 [Pseudomonadales bacterium]